MSVIIVDKSTRALSAAAVALSKVSAELNAGIDALVQEQTNLANDIHFKQQELDQVNEDLEIAARKAAAELRLRVQEDSTAVMEELLSQRGLITTTVEALNDAINERDQAISALESGEFKAVREAEQRVVAQYSMKLNQTEASHKVEIAELNANAKADKQTIAALTEQVNQLREDLKAEREARVAMAEAASKAQGVVVNAGR